MLFSSYFYSTSTSSSTSSRSSTSSTSSSNPPPAPTNTPTDAFDIAPRKDSFTSHSSRNSAATAFPSWPTRPDLYSTASSTSSAIEDAAPTAYLSDEDLLFEPESRPMTPSELSTEQVIERQRVFAEQERQRLQWQLQTRQMGLQFSGAATAEKKEKKRRPSAMKKRTSSSRVTMVRN